MPLPLVLGQRFPYSLMSHRQIQRHPAPARMRWDGQNILLILLCLIANTFWFVFIGLEHQGFYRTHWQGTWRLHKWSDCHHCQIGFEWRSSAARGTHQDHLAASAQFDGSFQYAGRWVSFTLICFCFRYWLNLWVVGMCECAVIVLSLKELYSTLCKSNLPSYLWVKCHKKFCFFEY